MGNISNRQGSIRLSRHHFCTLKPRGDGGVAGAESPLNQRLQAFWKEDGRVFLVCLISPRKLILPQG